MRDPLGIRVIGPLAPYVPGFVEELTERGYAAWSAVSYVRLICHLSRWLHYRHLAVAGLTPQRVGDFLKKRRSLGYAKGRSAGGMVGVLTGYLRGLGVMPEVTPPPADTFQERVVEEFATYAANERGIAAKSIRWSRYVAGLFLSTQCHLREASGRLEGLTPGDVSAFILAQSGHWSAVSLGHVSTALRALLRFLFVQRYTTISLEAAVPAMPRWRASRAQRALNPDEVKRLLASCDRNTTNGRRDFAILTVLSRLGLRAKEVASLVLEAVDWRNGELLVVGKGNRHDRLPLPADVGEALADYCLHSRHRGVCRALFLHGRAPYAALSSTAVSHVVLSACLRAGVTPVRAHRLRHSAATALRRAGAPLFEIGQILRHNHAVTTAQYARDDHAALATVARPWPGAMA